MKRSQSNNRDPVSLIWKKVEDVAERTTLLEKTTVMTIPTYNKAALPPDMLEAELFMGTDGSVNIWHNGAIKQIVA